MQVLAAQVMGKLIEVVLEKLFHLSIINLNPTNSYIAKYSAITTTTVRDTAHQLIINNAQ